MGVIFLPTRVTWILFTSILRSGETIHFVEMKRVLNSLNFPFFSRLNSETQSHVTISIISKFEDVKVGIAVRLQRVHGVEGK